MAGYEYNITVHGINCGNQKGNESGSLTIRPQGILFVGLCFIDGCLCGYKFCDTVK